MTYRNRDLLNLAYRMDCQIQIPGICEGGIGEPAHSNQQRHGKGMGIKAADVFFAASCRKCHIAIDHGSHLTKEQRQDYWQAGFERTLLALFTRNLVTVTDAPEPPQYMMPLIKLRKPYKRPSKINARRED